LQRTSQGGKALILQRLFGQKPKPIAALYDAIVAAARQPHFYAELDVPDSVDGRFDMIVLHLYLVLDRLREAPEDVRQNLTDYFFFDMDRQLREMGVGDLSVSKRVREMAEALYGRMTAYKDSEGDALKAALKRNIYAGADSVSVTKLAAWVIAARQKLLAQSEADIISGRVVFQ
jgi:cytochrome b pre-mRNA-processing protein 3